MKTSPYKYDIGRFMALALNPNICLDTLSNVSPPDDSVFPESGLIQISGAVPKELCDQAIREHDEFEVYREQQGCLIRNDKGRNLRLVNFHLKSQALLKIATLDAFHTPASAFFRRKSSVYTSLFYKHGSQQSAHIDTPFFWTRPFNLYVGVWVALEDVANDAGPLFYYPGSHKLFNTEEKLIGLYEKGGKKVNAVFDGIRSEAEKITGPICLDLKKGDAVIWHPGILHGGTLATNPEATRYSTVFHFAPVGVNVRTHNVFPNDFSNIPSYGLKKSNGNYYCRGRLPGVMV